MNILKERLMEVSQSALLIFTKDGNICGKFIPVMTKQSLFQSSVSDDI